MAFGRYTCGVQLHIMLNGVTDPRKRRFGGRTLQPKHAIANWCCHLANRKEVILPIAKLLWCLFHYAEV